MVSGSYLELYDYRCRVFAMNRGGNEALARGEDPESVLSHFRAERDMLFAQHSQSALNGRQKAGFQRLDYFPHKADAVVEATLEPTEEDESIEVVMSGGEQMPMRAATNVHFTWQQRSVALTAYWIEVYGGGLFLPFRDLTALEQTYGGGRYLFDTIKGNDFRILSWNDEERRILLDFNYAYNPSCAYNPRWSCPLAPQANWLDFPIEAGEKKFRDPTRST